MRAHNVVRMRAHNVVVVVVAAVMMHAPLELRHRGAAALISRLAVGGGWQQIEWHRARFGHAGLMSLTRARLAEGKRTDPKGTTFLPRPPSLWDSPVSHTYFV